MSGSQMLEFSRTEVEDGSWRERVLGAWAAGKVGLVKVRPEPSGDPELRRAIETMLSSNGSYGRGDRAIIHVRPAALALGCETAHLLRERGISAELILGLTTLAHDVALLLEAVYGPDQDYASADPAKLAGVTAGYRALLDPIEREGSAHWIVPIGTSPDPDSADVPALNLFSKVAGQALAPIGHLRAQGQIRSHDIWLNPSQLDVDRLNEDLAPERHWTLAEWRSLIFRSMAVGADELRKLALGIEGVRLTIEAALKGGTLRYEREDGTDFRYRVAERPVILDCGQVGNNALGGTTPFRSAITNQPTTEVFVGPREDSLDGVIVYTIPERTVHGVIRAPYRIEARAGRVVDVQAPDEESLRILKHYVGLAPYDGIALAGDEAAAFDLRSIIAEMAIAGFNPAMLPEIMNGRLRPVTGLVLTDEKLGDHQAFGSNDQFMGATPSSFGDHHVEHTDFVGSIARRITFVD